MADESRAQPSLELLDFWAAWCGPCKIMAPVLEQIEQEFKGKLSVRKLNVDEPDNQALVQQHNIMSIPTYMLMQNGEIVGSFIGVQPKSVLAEKIKSLLDANEEAK